MGHVIKTQILDVATNSTEGAFALQQTLSNFFYASILPVLEKTFDALVPDEKTVSLDKLEIDLGILTLSDIEKQEWARIVVNRIQREIKTGIQFHTAKNASIDTSLSVSAQWIYYMQRGYLPWNTISTDKIWFTRVLEAFSSDNKAIEQLRDLISKNPVALNRIVLVHSTEFLVHLLEVLTAKKQDKLQLVIETIKGIDKEAVRIDPKLVIQQTIHTIWKRILQLAAGNPAIPIYNMVEEAILTPLPLPVLRHLDTRITDTPVLQPFSELISQQIKKTGKIKAPLEEIDTANTKIIKPAPLPEDGLFIGHTGLVILHPFLKRCFEYAGLLNGAEFTTPALHQKAMALLHWMATGTTQVQEHEMVIHKILCGYPVHEPVETEIEISAEEKTIADELLDAVISSWSILKNTSRDGLREQFLQRNGKLIMKDGDTRLQVECNTVDVLLDHLPWGIGTIKLPWMPHLLKVEWR